MTASATNTNQNSGRLEILTDETVELNLNGGKHSFSSCPPNTPAVAFAGRLDNRKELLTRLGLEATSGLDEQTLLREGYRRWGPALPEYLLGDFCFLIWDPIKRCLIGARDPLGGQSLYFSQQGGRFIAARHLSAILNHSTIALRPNHQHLALSAIPRASIFLGLNTTPYEGIHYLPGGKAFRFDSTGLTQWSYWRPSPEARLDLPDSEVPEALRDLLFTAVQNRMPSDSDPAALLSGGLDSSAIVAIAASVLKKENRQLTAFSAVLPQNLRHQIVDERSYINEFSGFDNVRLVEITAENKGPFDDFERLIRDSGSPFHTSRHYLYAAFVEAAKAYGARTVLDGCFGELGPTTHGDGYLLELLREGRLPSLIRQLAQCGDVNNSGFWKTARAELLRPLAPSWLLALAGKGNRLDLMLSAQNHPFTRSYLDKFIVGNLAAIRARVSQQLSPSVDHRQSKSMEISLVQGSPRYEFLSRDDRRNLNFEFPFLDQRIVEFCLAAPGRLKIRRGYKRSLIRDALDGLLPPAIQWRTSKEPFSPDFHVRYNRQRPMLVDWLKKIAKGDPVREVIDVDRLLHMAGLEMRSNRCNTPNDFIAMHRVPNGVFMIAFLRQFPEFKA